jgi:hypothetical protein
MDRSRYRLLFALVLVLRVALCAQPRVTYDAISYTLVAEAVAAGQNVYAATSRYNYSPLWSGVVAGLWRIAGGRDLLFVLLVGLILTAGDAATARLLRGMARDGGAPEAAGRRIALLFFANPVSVLVSCYLRQFDGLSILFLLVAIRALSRQRRRDSWGAAAALSASLLIKHVTVLHPLLFWRRWRTGGLPLPLVLAPYAVFGLSFAPFLAASGAILDNVLLYGTGLRGLGGQRPGGIASLLAFPDGARGVPFLILLAGVAVAVALGRRVSLARGALLLFLAELVFAPGFAAQYLLWPMALGSLAPSAGYVLLTTLGAAFMVGEGRLLELPVAVTAMAAWTAALIWLLQEGRFALAAAPPEPVELQTMSTPSG